MDAPELRRAFTDFWVERGHLARPSASLIPHDPTLLFTVAGMVPFKPYFLGDEEPPAPRLTTIQKCVRAGGKHNDLDDIGRTNRHVTFFEMMGNFSFGDYFKREAIPWAWEFVTGVLGLDRDRLWVTVHVSDDEAETIWRDDVGLPAERVQRLDAENWWAAGDTGPCGPSSEIFIDLGPEHGAEGGPAHGGEERYVEIWNLVFMQFDRGDDGELRDLPKRGIDTGAGFERMLGVLQGVDSVWEIDIFVTLLARASELTGTTLGADGEDDVSLRILADHARTMTFLVSDGVFPSNEDRGYVLRRIIRRAVRHAYRLGVEGQVTPALIDAVVEVMGDAYPELHDSHDFVRQVVVREEERFLRTLATGSQILEQAVARLTAGDRLAGDVAFQLHDTYGFPVELTEEMLAERGITLDRAAFDELMGEQRRRARAARQDEAVGPHAERYRELLDEFGPTEFIRDTGHTTGRVLAVLEGGHTGGNGDSAAATEIVLDRTPFYAEGGGQMGDTGTITTATGTAEILNTTYALPGLHRHIARLVEGEITPGQEATAQIDEARRDAIRRNHTGTHILHWALRHVLGDHVKQAGSLVAPDRLRFDFSHYEAVTPEQLAAIEDAANAEILRNDRCLHYETTMDRAREVGAIAFFGEKYGDIVRVLEAGPHSVELCGGTHVSALGDIGHLRIVSEGSIGSNLRRIEAITGAATVERMRHDEDLIAEVADLVGAAPDDVPGALRKRLDEIKALRTEVRQLQQQAASGRAGELAAGAVDGVVVARVDGSDRDALRDLAVAVRDHDGVRAVVLGAALDGGGVALVGAVGPDAGITATELLDQAAATVLGGFNRRSDAPLIIAGGKNVAALDDALDQARAAAGIGDDPA
jgi:alanyl-tRNA synthetase